MINSKNILLLLFMIFTIQIWGQENQTHVGMKITVQTAVDQGGGNYLVTALIQDETNVFDGTDVATGQNIWVKSLSLGDDCNKYQITDIACGGCSVLVGQVTVLVNDTDSQGSPTVGIGAISDTTFVGWVSGIGNDLNQCLQSFTMDQIQTAIDGAGGGGEVNTASNLGGDEGLFTTKSGVDLPFKGLTAGTGISLSSDANSVTITNSVPEKWLFTELPLGDVTITTSVANELFITDGSERTTELAVNEIKQTYDLGDIFVQTRITGYGVELNQYSNENEGGVTPGISIQGESEDVSREEHELSITFGSYTNTGTLQTFGDLEDDWNIGSIIFGGGSAFGYGRGASITGQTSEDWSASSVTGADLYFRTSRNGVSSNAADSIRLALINHTDGTVKLQLPDYGGTEHASVLYDTVATFDSEGRMFKAHIDDIAPAGGGGEANTASNLGGDEGLFTTKSGVDLPFKGLSAGTGISLSSDANSVTITTPADQTVQQTEVSLAGSLVGTRKELNFIQGTGATLGVVDNAGQNRVDITISATGAGGGETNTASNIGTAGVGVFDQKSGVDLQFRNINAGSSRITVTDDGANNEIDIDVDETQLTITESQISDLSDDNGIFTAGNSGTNVPSAFAVGLTNTINFDNNTLVIDGVNNQVLVGTATATEGTFTTQSTAVTGKEVPFLATVSDKTGSKMMIANGTSTDNAFIPAFIGFNEDNGIAMSFQGYIEDVNDTGTQPVIHFVTTTTDDSSDPLNGSLGAVATRPLVVMKNLSSADWFHLAADGDVGLGGTPTAKFHVFGGTQAILNNMVLDIDQTLGAGQDNFVLTWDNGTGEARFEASAGGSDGNGIFTAGNSGTNVASGFEIGVTDNLNFDNNTLYIDGTADRVGVGEASPDSKFHITDGSNPFRSERTDLGASNWLTTGALKTTTSTNMTDGFGPAFGFQIEDDAATQQIIGAFGAFRDGADNSGALQFRVYDEGTGVEALIIRSNGIFEFDSDNSSQVDVSTSTGGIFNIGNFAFDTDQVLGAGQDNFVLTYDDGTGTLSFEASAGGSGEANTASNLGGDEGLFTTKSGVDLPFKGLSAGTGISLSSDANSVTITTPADQTVQQTEVSLAGSLVGTRKELNFIQGTGATLGVVDNAGQNRIDITISATGAGGGETNTASNIGTAGVGVFDQKSGVDLQFRNINAGSSRITITDDSGNNEIDIDVDESAVDHDALSGFNSLEHVDHSLVNVTAGVGLDGGGNITVSRTLFLDFSELTTVTDLLASDYVVTWNSGGAEQIITKANFEADLAIQESQITGLNYYTTSDFNTDLATKTTADLTEGANLYFTDERVDDRTSALIQDGTGLSWTYDDGSNTLTGNVQANTTNQQVQVGEAGTVAGTRPEINFIEGTNITLTVADNAGQDRVDVTISGPAGSGEANTASNLGAGEGLFTTKSGVDLPFKSLVGGTNISLTSDANTVTINLDGHGSGHISGGADEVDGDQLDIDFNPSVYTPTTSPAEASSVDHLTAHLAGIDDELDAVVNANVGDQSSGTVDLQSKQMYATKIDMTGLSSITMTLNNPINAGVYVFIFTDADDGDTVTWSNVLYEDGTTVGTDILAGGRRMITLIYDGTNYYTYL